jgi:hypothetical protein
MARQPTPPVLTLHKGGPNKRRASKQAVTEHPIETARRALRAAAELEDERWELVLRQMALSLPKRAAVKGGE